MCGEYAIRSGEMLDALGSPPRVWGIRESLLAETGIERFTPTCVGNTCHLSWQSESNAVHPHVCGEYFINGDVLGVPIGSPPRVWGILSLFAISSLLLRFTPTCVGNTRTPPSVAAIQTVHPHVCGEYQLAECSASATNGSPPRVWGIR